MVQCARRSVVKGMHEEIFYLERNYFLRAISARIFLRASRVFARFARGFIGGLNAKKTGDRFFLETYRVCRQCGEFFGENF